MYIIAILKVGPNKLENMRMVHLTSGNEKINPEKQTIGVSNHEKKSKEKKSYARI
jgi:hypothetical protein